MKLRARSDTSINECAVSKNTQTVSQETFFFSNIPTVWNFFSSFMNAISSTLFNNIKSAKNIEQFKFLILKYEPS